MLHEWLTMFKVQGMNAWWLPASDGVTRCDHCRSRVWPEQPRFRIANGQGKGRASDKSPTARQYLCIDCAFLIYHQHPPAYTYHEQVHTPPADQDTLL
jgi:hypothetical protein